MLVTNEQGNERKIRIIWNKNDPTEVEKARKLFERYIRQGWIAVIEKDGELSMIFEFNPELGSIILLPIVAGG